MKLPAWIEGRISGNSNLIRQKRPDNCVQTVVAMLLDTDVETVESVAGTNGKMTVDQTLTLLGRVGIYCRPVASSLVADFWPMYYKRHGSRKMRGLGFSLPKQAGKAGHAFLINGSSMYDPATGESEAINENSLKQLDWLALLPADAVGGEQLAGVKAKIRKQAAGRRREARENENPD